LWVQQAYRKETHELEGSVLYPDVDVITFEEIISKLAE